jgi:hypothetical protein
VQCGSAVAQRSRTARLNVLDDTAEPHMSAPESDARRGRGRIVPDPACSLERRSADLGAGKGDQTKGRGGRPGLRLSRWREWEPDGAQRLAPHLLQVDQFLPNWKNVRDADRSIDTPLVVSVNSAV